jgi:hypothetical protein
MAAPGAPESPEPTPEPSPARWRTWWVWLVLLAPVIATAVVVGIVLLVWPR